MLEQVLGSWWREPWSECLGNDFGPVRSLTDMLFLHCTPIVKSKGCMWSAHILYICSTCFGLLLVSVSLLDTSCSVVDRIEAFSHYCQHELSAQFRVWNTVREACYIYVYASKPFFVFTWFGYWCHWSWPGTDRMCRLFYFFCLFLIYVVILGVSETESQYETLIGRLMHNL